ncbi:MAG: TIGR03915 family putative DNA repair protein [Clostridia bacterium]|nr:TIGR03915 family putative DNA repair protein [Clostridia bacterium]
MTVFLTEKSFTGLCSALFYSFTEGIIPDRVFEYGKVSQNFTDNYIVIENDEEKAERVSKALKKYCGSETFNYIGVCLLSCEENALKTAFDFAYLTLRERKNVIDRLALKQVSDFLFTVKRVLYERHKFTGFIRFKETARGILYAPYSPDNDITELLCPHFVKRLSNVPFIIHDVKRNVAGVSDGRRFTIMKTENQAVLELSKDEKEWENLWKDYYKAANIKERKNRKQQNNLMPMRYRKFLPETYEI